MRTEPSKTLMRYQPMCVLLAVAAPAVAQPRGGTSNEVDAILVEAHAARARGDQRAVLACGLDLRGRDPTDVRGHYLIAAACGSIGPSFSRTAALQAFAKVASLLHDENFARLRGLAGVPSRADLGGLTAAVAGWRRDLTAGKRLLLAPDRAVTARLASRLGDRIAQAEAWVDHERGRLDRARKQKAESEKALRREQTRKRRAGETFVDVQPIVDRIHASERLAQTCARRVREFEAQIEELRVEVESARACLQEMH